jgi:hypothetical protein
MGNPRHPLLVEVTVWISSANCLGHVIAAKFWELSVSFPGNG